MASNWKKVAVSDIAVPVLGGTPSKAHPEYWEGGTIPWATAKDISSANSRYVYSTENNITQQGLKNSAAKLLPAGTIVITARGTVGAIAQLGREMTFNQTCYGLVPKRDYVSNDYLYYALKATLAEMKTLAYGTVFETITKKTFDSWRIPLPPLPEQRAIAHILGTLDDKIELNRRMNETLEAMARALFKSWFVDFDPVVVNAIKAGNPIPEKFAKRAAHYRQNPDALRLPEHILRLFPDRFVDSELGPIPEGWEVVSIGEMADILSGKRPKQRSKVYSEENPIPLWGGNGPMAFVSEPLFNEPIILTGRVGTLGAVFRIVKPSWPSDNTLVIRPHDSKYYDYLYFSILTLDLISLNRGSTQPLLAQSDLKSQRTIRPPMGALSAFADQAGVIFSESQQLEEESQILAILRDTLLPKLVSGALQPLDVEKVLEGLK